MRAFEVAVLLIIIIISILIFCFVAAKGIKKKIALINADGSEVTIDAEIVDTCITRAKGLMGKKKLREDEGMLFIFEKSSAYSFWMLNTTIPLEVIFFGEDGAVADIIEMEPCGLNISKCRLYKPRAKAKYALEVNRGFCNRHSIVIGKSTLIVDSLTENRNLMD